uniref:Uncharacterized protein n=1 Tax=Arion vulgaris TaxID=1028688 RepID=A0A0B7B1C9_9EUPU
MPLVYRKDITSLVYHKDMYTVYITQACCPVRHHQTGGPNYVQDETNHQRDARHVMTSYYSIICIPIGA